LVNIAHGDLIVLGAYLGLSVTAILGLHPLLALFVVVPCMAVIGYVLQRGILNQAGALETASVSLAGLSLGVLPLLTFAIAVAVIAALQWTFYRTALGRAFRATSDNAEIAQLMGLNRRHIFGLAMALALGVTAIAGIMLGIRTSFDPSIGGGRLIFGFEAVIIGGLGNLWGTLVGGVILGVAQTVGAKIDPGWQLLAGHVAFLVILAVRPQGLFPRISG